MGQRAKSSKLEMHVLAAGEHAKTPGTAWNPNHPKLWRSSEASRIHESPWLNQARPT